MGEIQGTQRNATRNQSTVDYDRKQICIWDNRFVEGIFKNTTAGSITLVPGNLVARSITVVNGFIPVTIDNLADVIGIAVQEGDVVLAASATSNINIVVSGGIDGGTLSLPAGVTLNTVVGGKVLKDVLNSLGLHIGEGATDHTKLDN